MQVQGINSLVGSSDGYIPPGAAGRATVFDDSPAVPSAGLFKGNGTDGTEMAVGALVLAALAVLILFRIGGFQAIIAS